MLPTKVDWSVAFLLVFLLPHAICQPDVISPCGPNTLTITVPEYPGPVSGSNELIPENERPNYRALLVKTANSNLTLTAVFSPKTPDLDPTQAFDIQYLDVQNAQGFYLTVKRKFDRDGSLVSSDDDTNTLEFSLYCREPSSASGSSLTYYHNVLLQLRDVNDNPPRFTQSSYSITVNELTPVGTTVFRQAFATDLDQGNNRLIEYRIESDGVDAGQDWAGIFTLPIQDNAMLVLSKPLDYESLLKRVGSPSQVKYIIKIIATDRSSSDPPLSSSVYLTIFLEDGDDLGPYFVHPTCPAGRFKPCAEAVYDATLISGTTGQLSFYPVPRFTDDDDRTVVIKARDGDGIGAPVNCSTAQTIPPGYEDRFRATSARIGTTAEYQCDVEVVTAINHEIISDLQIVVQATEETFNAYTEEATILVTILPPLPSSDTAQSASSLPGSTSNIYLPTSTPASLTTASPSTASDRNVPVSTICPKVPDTTVCPTPSEESDKTVVAALAAVVGVLGVGIFILTAAVSHLLGKIREQNMDPMKENSLAATNPISDLNMERRNDAFETDETADEYVYDDFASAGQISPVPEVDLSNYDRLEVYENKKDITNIYTDLKVPKR